ncbi:hypothetical protein Ancab_022794 [Ancistrocladus abbreviatus]
MATGTGGDREARRRRILEGGSDRLALITGRAQPLSSGGSLDLDTTRCYPTSSLSSFQDLPKSNLSSQPSVSRNEGDIPSNYALPKHDQFTQSNQFDAFGGGTREESFSDKSDPGIVPSKASAYEVHGQAESSRAIQGAPRSDANVQQHLAPKINFANIFTYQQVTSAVAATEQLRMFCSLMMAFLVVLSYMGFPIVSSCLIRSIIQFRPLFLVLLTNITFIFQHLISGKQRSLGKAGNAAGKSLTADGFYGWAADAGKALEVGLMALSVLSALFMDCSMYAILVICGLSVV